VASTPTNAKADLFATLDHVDAAYRKVKAVTGPTTTHVLRPPDLHKLTEGLFLNAWASWEAFMREVFLLDLVARPDGCLAGEITKYRTKGAPRRLAELIAGHPDDGKWIEWSSFDEVAKRADALLGAGHRFSMPDPPISNLRQFRKVRNGIAHKSENAWASFKDVAKKAPFSLGTQSFKGITPGRFLSSHQVNGVDNILFATSSLRTAATKLVP
jgi:hypothetical protein